MRKCNWSKKVFISILIYGHIIRQFERFFFYISMILDVSIKGSLIKSNRLSVTETNEFYFVCTEFM